MPEIAIELSLQPPRVRPVLWRFSIEPSRAEPAGLFAYFYGLGIRFTISGDWLVAEVLPATAERRDAAEAQELGGQYAGSLALSVRHVQAFREKHSGRQVGEELRRLSASTSAGAVVDAAGGLEPLAHLIDRDELSGADLDLACLACYRGQVAEVLRRAELNSLLCRSAP